MNKDFSEIQKVVEKYLDLVYEGAETLPNGFYENAFMMGVRDNKLVKAPLSNLTKRDTTPKDKGDARNDALIKIEVAHPNMAYAKVKCDILPLHYTDILVLVKDHGEWKIVSKMWSGVENTDANWYDSLQAQSDAIREIQDCVSRYVEGVYHLDSDFSLKEFEETTRMISTGEDGAICDVPIQVLEERWANVKSAAELGIPAFARFELVDMTGTNTALVKVFDSKLWSSYYDYLFVAKIDNEWKIINKVTILPVPIEH